MSQTSTQTDLLLYAYNETKLQDSDRIQRSIDGDPLVAEEFREIVRVLEMLDQVKTQPEKRSEEKIFSVAFSN